MMSNKILGCRLRAQPHIDSRIKLLKKQYHAISKMLGLRLVALVGMKISSVLWLRKVIFPYYEELRLVFGTDRANGQGVMGFSETVDEIDKEIGDEQDNDFDHFAPLDELNGNANMSSTNTPSTQTCKKGKKRSRNEYPIVGASDSIRLLADCFKFETDVATRRMKVFDKLKKIEGLTVAQRLKVSQLFVHDQANVDYLFTLDEEIKLDFLLQLLD
ncbi:hypothetical protein UlMin_007720 [Ulmus minor]